MKKILLSIVLVLCVLVLTGCGSNKLVGTWKDGKDDPLHTIWTFKKNDKCEMQNDYFISKGTYNIDDDKVTITLDTWTDKKVYKYSIKNNKLTLTATDVYSNSYIDLKK